MRNHRVIKEN